MMFTVVVHFACLLERLTNLEIIFKDKSTHFSLYRQNVSPVLTRIPFNININTCRSECHFLMKKNVLFIEKKLESTFFWDKHGQIYTYNRHPPAFCLLRGMWVSSVLPTSRESSIKVNLKAALGHLSFSLVPSLLIRSLPPPRQQETSSKKHLHICVRLSELRVGRPRGYTGVWEGTREPELTGVVETGRDDT